MAGLGSMMLAFALLVPGQGVGSPRAAARERARVASAAGEAAERTAAEVVQMRKSVEGMTEQIRLLRQDLGARAQSDARARDTAQMVQLEEGIARLKRELAEIRARLRAAHGREDDARLRLANIDAQLIVAGGVNRQESERVLRSALTRQIDEATEEQTAAERDVARLAEAIALAEREADALRARLQDASPPASERAEQPDTRSGDASTPAQPGSEPPPQPEP